MSTKIFVNLPVKNLEKTKAFFSHLGYSYNPQFTDEKAACMVISEDIYVMLLVEQFYNGFTKKQVPDTSKYSEAILALSCDSKEAVDSMVQKATDAGGKATDKQDLGFMYSCSFEDLDGHIWELFWMDPAHVQQQQTTPAMQEA